MDRKIHIFAVFLWNWQPFRRLGLDGGRYTAGATHE